MQNDKESLQEFRVSVEKTGKLCSGKNIILSKVKANELLNQGWDFRATVWGCVTAPGGVSR